MSASVSSDSRAREFMAAHVIAELERELAGDHALDDAVAPLAGVFAEVARHEVREVLEVGCGRGDRLIPLLRRGLWVTGLDVEPEAVARCHERLRERGLSTRVMHGDARTLTADASYDAVLLMRGLLELLTDEAEQLEALRRARRALRPGGALIVEHRNLLAMWPVFGRELVRTGTLADGRRYELGRRASLASFEGRVVERRWARLWPPREGPGEFDLFEQHDHLRLTTVSEVQALLRHAGFEIARVEPRPLVDDPWLSVSRYGVAEDDPAFVWLGARRPC